MRFRRLSKWFQYIIYDTKITPFKFHMDPHRVHAFKKKNSFQIFQIYPCQCECSMRRVVFFGFTPMAPDPSSFNASPDNVPQQPAKSDELREGTRVFPTGSCKWEWLETPKKKMVGKWLHDHHFSFTKNCMFQAPCFSRVKVMIM